MRTNIVIDEKLLKEAFLYASVATKKDLINLVLLEFIQHHRKKDLRELRGKVKIQKDYDYKKLRIELKDK